MKFEKGFTLIEAMFTILVLTIGMAIVLQVFPLGFNIGKSSQMKAQGILLAQEKIEEMNSKSYQSILTGVQTEPSLNHPFEAFSRQTTVVYVNANLEESAGDTGLKKIRVIVSWNPLPFGNNSAELITLVAEE